MAARTVQVSAADPAWTGTHEGTVTMRATVDGQQLAVTDRPDDGKYTVIVQARCQESSAAKISSRQGIELTVLGRAEKVDGLDAARAECMSKYLKSFQEQPPSIQAVVAAWYAQLGRPPDPLWDPDPTMLEIQNQSHWKIRRW